MNRRDACAPFLYGSVLVQRVGDVVVGARKREAVGGFEAVADHVELVGAVEAGDAAVGAGDLAEGIVGPGGGARGGKCTAGLGKVRALADGVHGVVILRNDVGASFVLLGGENIPRRLPSVGHGVGWGRDRG